MLCGLKSLEMVLWTAGKNVHSKAIACNSQKMSVNPSDLWCKLHLKFLHWSFSLDNWPISEAEYWRHPQLLYQGPSGSVCMCVCVWSQNFQILTHTCIQLFHFLDEFFSLLICSGLLYSFWLILVWIFLISFDLFDKFSLFGIFLLTVWTLDSEVCFPEMADGCSFSSVNWSVSFSWSVMITSTQGYCWEGPCWLL